MRSSPRTQVAYSSALTAMIAAAVNRSVGNHLSEFFPRDRRYLILGPIANRPNDHFTHGFAVGMDAVLAKLGQVQAALRIDPDNFGVA